MISIKDYSITVSFGKYYKYLELPCKSWIKARKLFRRPSFHFYFGPMNVKDFVAYSQGQEKIANQMVRDEKDFILIKNVICLLAITSLINSPIRLIIDNGIILFFINLITSTALVVYFFFKTFAECDRLKIHETTFNIKTPYWVTKSKGYHFFASTEYVKWCTSKWFPILLSSSDVGWKTKWSETDVRYERPGYFSIIFGRNVYKAWQFVITVTAPKGGQCPDYMRDEIYWTMLLTYLQCGKDIDKTKEILSGCWTGDGTKYPEWDENFLLLEKNP